MHGYHEGKIVVMVKENINFRCVLRFEVLHTPHSYCPLLYIKDTLLPAQIQNVGTGNKLRASETSNIASDPSIHP